MGDQYLLQHVSACTAIIMYCNLKTCSGQLTSHFMLDVYNEHYFFSQHVFKLSHLMMVTQAKT